MMESTCEKLDLNSLQLRLYAEFDAWTDFVAAVDEFQRKTSIKLTITTSRKLKSRDRGNKRRKTFKGINKPGSGLEDNDLEESIDSSGDGLNDDDSRSQESSYISIKGFEYQYLKLTCKHYGGYKSTSKGIRPNQRTAKLMCPTYIYACFDHYKQKFVVKQMVVDCNHELKDEHVLISKLFKDKEADNISSDNGEPTPKKKYIKVRNRNVLKIPLDSPSPSNYVTAPVIRIKCNHELSESCMAASLTAEDLHSIHELFFLKSKKDQNELILEWIEVVPSDLPHAVAAIFRLPTFHGALLRVCQKTFYQVLRIANNRVTDLIRANYDQHANLKHENKQPGDSREIENCIANILTSFCKEGETEETHQVIYCDTVDVPYAEDTIEEAYPEENISNMIESSSSLKNDTRNAVKPLDSDKPPTIKIVDRSASGDKYYIEINCTQRVILHNVSVDENDEKTIKISFTQMKEQNYINDQ